MNLQPDRDLYLFLSKRERKGKRSFHHFFKNMGKGGKRWKRLCVSLIRTFSWTREQVRLKTTLLEADSETTFSRVWEKLKSGPKPPRQTPGRSGSGTTEFGLKLLREILFLGLSGVERLKDKY